MPVSIIDGVAIEPNSGGLITDTRQHTYGWAVHVVRLRAEVPALYDPLLAANNKAEVYTVQCVADSAGSLASTFYTFNVPGQTRYYAWFNVNSSSADPKTITNPTTGLPMFPILQMRTGVEIAISANDTASTIATALQTGVNALTDVSATVSTDTVTITNANDGYTSGIINGGTGFTFAVTTEGKAGEFIYDYKFTNDYVQDYDVELYSGVLSVEGARDKDKIRVLMIDKNNVLGIGKNAVLTEYVQEFHLDGTTASYENHIFTPPDRAKLLPKGVFIRILFTTTDAANASKVIIKGRLDGFKDPNS